MTRWNDLKSRHAMLDAAGEWRTRCFFNDGSILSDKQIWTLENVRILRQRVVDNPIWEKDRDFEDKLIQQLNGANSSVIWLAAEILWFVYLIPRSIHATNKQNRIARIMVLANPSWQTNGFFDDKVLEGMSTEGVAYNTFRYDGLVFLLRLLESWKAKGDEERQAFRQPEASWGFAEWSDEFLAVNQDGNRQRTPLRNALLYWLYPDTFERVVSTGHKENIVRDFVSYLAPDSRAKYLALPARKPLLDLDRFIFEIRQSLEAEYGQPELDFYVRPLDILWFHGTKPKGGTPLENLFLKERVTEGDIHRAVRNIKKRISQRAKKIDTFRRNHKGRLFCEVCDTEASNYPESLRERVFEIHHIEPLAGTKGVVKTGLDDLAVLCANCHRAIHAGDPPPTMEGLRCALRHELKMNRTGD